MTLYLTRARLRRDAPIVALKELLVPAREDERIQTAHKLVWTLFADTPDRRRDFLWREAEPGRFYVLSERIPSDPHRLFELDEPKSFAPALRRGDRLAFALRANPTVSKPTAPRTRGKRHDIVMNAIRDEPKERRADARRNAIAVAGRAWLERQGAKSGFELDPDSPLHIDGYRVLAARSKGGMRLGVVDFCGVLNVREPDLLNAAIARGFGRAKAFGFGLMLIRRA